MRSHLLPIVLTLALVLAACEPPPEEEAAPVVPSQAEVEAAIGGLREAWISAENAGDAAALTALLTDDGVLMPPNAPAATGQEAIQSYFQSQFDQFTFEVAVVQHELEAVGDWAFTRGTYTVTITPKAGGKPMEDSGKYLNIGRRQPDGSWKVARHIWNSDKPLPGTAEE